MTIQANGLSLSSLGLSNPLPFWTLRFFFSPDGEIHPVVRSPWAILFGRRRLSD